MRILIASSAVAGVILTVLSSTAFAQTRQKQPQQNRFCLEIRGENQARCAYQTLAQCERAKPRGSTERCLDRAYVIAAPSEPPASPDQSPSKRGVTKHGGSSK